MKEQDLLQLKSEFSTLFKKMQFLINDSKRFEELITDYIECKNTIDKLNKATNKKSKKLLEEYRNILGDLETEIFAHLNKKKF